MGNKSKFKVLVKDLRPSEVNKRPYVVKASEVCEILPDKKRRNFDAEDYEGKNQMVHRESSPFKKEMTIVEGSSDEVDGAKGEREINQTNQKVLSAANAVKKFKANEAEKILKSVGKKKTNGNVNEAKKHNSMSTTPTETIEVEESTAGTSNEPIGPSQDLLINSDSKGLLSGSDDDGVEDEDENSGKRGNSDEDSFIENFLNVTLEEKNDDVDLFPDAIFDKNQLPQGSSRKGTNAPSHAGKGRNEEETPGTKSGVS
ncbi:hypothetical protein ONE63_008099 [Megalurothrips usitatus]|uniref:Uncharacterized protein n=1 Tax=Megalurothrips usitatus TaxID=439358 RepID=A0AAV7XPS1_9NEOP|nr:hypothetical protein ONE63_008099 [Megalurothrips usitatus]